MQDIYQVLTVREVHSPTPRARTLVLEPQPGETLRYEPGQYLTLVHPQYGGEVRRSYSFNSTPVLHEPPAITVKRVDNGLFSRWLVDQIQVDDQVHTSGVGGFFTLPPNPDDYDQLILLAAGSGITPIFSLLKTALHAHPHLRVLLFYSNRSAAETLFLVELEDLAQRLPGQLHIELFYSDNPLLYRAHLHKELLETLVKEQAPYAPGRTLGYLCGPLNYMRMGTYGLHEAGLPLSHIRRELFYTGADVRAPVLPPDTAPHRVGVRARGQLHELLVQYPDTILQAAKRQGLHLPYSCEVGQCGNCAVRCTQGRVWMATNEVLTDRELARGLVLTCTGYPVGGDVELDFDGH
ncbi:hypothetical protein AUC43_05755 [Hymenobacter sedentarius]|uniref:Oxidoreductase n=1 Tax=Hymenobacter sedentarius TaxID=1411621 RepID=A0A0U3SER0_9BACT|nr:ferredoxin--NADP reductase [Hymenobacter sedentarius]ALW84628.1 hypothetical protein AUC43_05755 [Hymenobacter sedentarius]